MNKNANQLVSIFNKDSFVISIGKFTGGGKTVYTSSNDNSGLFFCAGRYFRMAGRLLHIGDGLALYESNTVEMEVLSKDAILPALELPLSAAGSL